MVCFSMLVVSRLNRECLQRSSLRTPIHSLCLVGFPLQGFSHQLARHILLACYARCSGVLPPFFIHHLPPSPPNSTLRIIQRLLQRPPRTLPTLLHSTRLPIILLLRGLLHSTLDRVDRIGETTDVLDEGF